MSTMAASFIRADDWNADVYGTVSAAFRISATLRQERNLLWTFLALNRLNNLLDGFFGGFFELIENAQDGKLQPTNVDGMTHEEWSAAVDQLWNMHSALDHLCQLSIRKGLRKKALLTRQLQRLESSRERVVDLIQWVQYSTNPEELEGTSDMFSAGLEELQRGETVTVE